MYHIVKVCIQHHRKMTSLYSLPLFQRASHLKTGRVNTSKLGQLTCFKSLREIVNIAKIHRHYSWDVRGWCGDKKEGTSTSDLLSRPSVGRFYDRMNIMVGRNCMNIPKCTLIGYISLSNGGWRKII